MPQGNAKLHILLLESEPFQISALYGLLLGLDPTAEITKAGNVEQLQAHLRSGHKQELVIVGLPNKSEQARGLVHRIRVAVDTKLILICNLSDREQVRRYYSEGIDGVIPRTATGQILHAAIKLVLAGSTYLPPEVFAPQRRRPTDPTCSIAKDDFRLTPQQTKVLRLVSQGLSNKQIAHELSIAEGTVKLHVNAILKALKVPNRTSAALLAREVLGPT